MRNLWRGEQAAAFDGQTAPSLEKLPTTSAGPSSNNLGTSKVINAVGGTTIASNQALEPKRVSFEESAFTATGDPRQILHKRISRCHRAAPDRASQAKVKSEFEKPRTSKKDAACPYTEEWVVYVDEPETVYIYEKFGHMGHTPGDADDLRYLPIDSDLVEVIEKLLCTGLTPQQIVDHLHKEVLSDMDIFKQLDDVIFKHPNMNLTARDIENIRKRMYTRTRINKNDVKAVEKLVELLGSDVVLYYHPQVYDEEEEKVKEHLRLAISTPAQRAMLKQFGGKLCFMDAVFGLSKYGFPTLALVVRDEFGHGFPAGYCISSNEDGAIWSEFLTAILQSADLNPADVTFMIDKSTIEIAAIGQIGSNYLLCKFHMMQEWERFLRSTESRVHGKSNEGLRIQILNKLSELQKITNPAAFEAKSLQFEAYLAEKVKGESKINGELKNPVLHKYLNWKKDAIRWAAFGRLHVADLRSDTNNLVEAHFRRIKHISSQGRIATRLDQQIFLLLDEVTHFIITRIQRLGGGVGISAERADSTLEHHIKLLSDPVKEYIQFMADIPGSIGDTGMAVSRSTKSDGSTYNISVADGSCCCMANVRWPCKHVEAACKHSGRCPTLELVKSAAGIIRICRETMVEAIDEKNGIFAVAPLCMYSNPQLAKQQKRLYDVNTIEKYCSCHMFSAHNVCPHLFALLDVEDREILISEAPMLIAELDHDKVMLPVNCRRRLMPPPMIEPTAGAGRELELLHTTKNQVYSTSKSTRENDFIAADARTLTDLAKDLDPGARHLLHIKMQALIEEARGSVRVFRKKDKDQQRTKTRSTNRSEDDRKSKPLFNNRSAAGKVVVEGRSSRRDALRGAEEQFAEEQEQQQGIEEGFVAAKARGGPRKNKRPFSSSKGTKRKKY